METITWIIAHADELITTVLAVLAGLAAIATWTETKRDDTWIARLQRWVKAFGEYLASRNT